MNEKTLDEYKSSFKFGGKFLILLSLFALPPVMGFALAALFSSTLERSAITYTPELEVIRIQSYPYTSSKESRGKIEGSYILESGQEIFVLLSRKPINPYEENQVYNTVESIIKHDTTERINDKNISDKNSSDKNDNNYFYYRFEDWNNTAVYGRSTTLGNWLNGIVFFVLTIICIALYFPLAKAMANLFKRKPLL